MYTSTGDDFYNPLSLSFSAEIKELDLKTDRSN